MSCKICLHLWSYHHNKEKASFQKAFFWPFIIPLSMSPPHAQATTTFPSLYLGFLFLEFYINGIRMCAIVSCFPCSWVYQWYSFLFLSTIPLYRYITTCLSIYLLTNTRIVSSLRLLHIICYKHSNMIIKYNIWVDTCFHFSWVDN